MKKYFCLNSIACYCIGIGYLAILGIIGNTLNTCIENKFDQVLLVSPFLLLMFAMLINNTISIINLLRYEKGV